MLGVNPLDHPICFAHPARIAMSAWIGHVPFGMYLIDLLRPKALAELGTHYGVSYCAFCQAVKELGLDTRCYAIDTWEGDEQTGFYGSEVLTDVEEHHNARYSSFSRLIQSSFDEALNYFPDNTFDLLHIDGYHSYEAVKTDFEKWLPKMTARGVILLHDINVRERNFGVWKFWNELKLKYASFEFVHSHGLGVLAVGNDYPQALKSLLYCSEADAVSVRRFFSNLGGRIEGVLELQNVKSRLEMLQAEIQSKDAHTLALNAQISAQTETFNTHLQDATRQIAVLADQLQERNELLSQKGEELVSYDAKLVSATAQLEDLTIQMEDLTIQMEDLTIQMEDLASQKENLQRQTQKDLKDKDVKLKSALMQLRSGERRVQEMAQMLAGMEDIHHSGSYRLVRALSAPLRWKYRLTLKRWFQRANTPSIKNSPGPKSWEKQIGSVQRISTTMQTSEKEFSRTPLSASLIGDLFDAEWYLRENSEVAKANLDPLDHFLRQGAIEGRAPNPLFDPTFYLSSYPEAGGDGADALRHYLTEGWRKGYKPNPKFDPAFYLEMHRDIDQAGVEPLTHFFTTGQHEGRTSCLEEIEMGALFDGEWYLRENPDVAQAKLNPLIHYVRQGATEGRAPNALFDPKFYLTTYPEAAIGGGADPLRHYLTHGWKKGYKPNPRFDPAFYLEMYPDIARTGMEPLTHFVTDGLREGRAGCKEDVYLEPFEADFEISREPSPDASPVESDVKAIAFYLPQFHPIPENDKWWGPGFTEWTNVRAGEPQFKGHYQPHVPSDLNYYDLRDASVLERQIALAQQYGIYGFCFYYYWFGGKILLDLPIRRMLERGKPDFPFCICWANENWTRRWDGMESDILIGQQHSREDDLAFLHNIESILLHKNYIRVDGKPLLIIYQPSILPEVQATATRWREAFRARGNGEIFLAATQTFAYRMPPDEFGFDAVIQFPPHVKSGSIRGLAQGLNKSFAGHIYDYNYTKWSFIDELRQLSSSRRIYPGVMPSWDNTARLRKKSSVWINATPESYYDWLMQVTNFLRRHMPREEKLVFINAWNEWAEGCHLEPDQTFGYAWLNATKLALQSAKAGSD